ncbi:MAG: ATP-binding protein [Verrucomicrobia bacterium]|nr:ATP-binding protein [Verrucomicrobiota bacterium]
MSTRRVESGERRRQNGWASATEYDVLRGLNGTAVAFKAALQDEPEKRQLLYFLQALSLREGGTKRIARELVEMFPERIGTPTMIKIGCKPGKRLTKEQYAAIRDELFGRSDSDVWDEILYRETEVKKLETPPENAANELCAECRDRCGNLADFIEELCCDPKLEVVTRADACRAYRGIVGLVLDDARHALENNPHIARERPHLQTALDKKNDFRFAELSCFEDVLGALYEYQHRHTERARADFVETSIGKIVFEAMDYALDTGRSALIEGNSGFGKTTALKAWCEMHMGRARYVQLSGITSRTSFLKRIAKACGVASGGGMSSDRIQTRVEEFLQRTKLILVIDEGHYLWPQGKRITTHPELINWINTALYNEGVPFAISATKQFSLRRQVVENQTTWSSEQLRRRTRKVFPLPDAPTTDDLRAVARKLLNGLGESAVEFVVGYAMASHGYFQTITDAIEDAQLIAKRAGRERITGKDLQTAVKDWRAPSDAALQRVFDSKPVKARRGPRAMPSDEFEAAGTPISEPLNRLSQPLQPAFSGSASGRRETQPAVPVLTG